MRQKNDLNIQTKYTILAFLKQVTMAALDGKKDEVEANNNVNNNNNNNNKSVVLETNLDDSHPASDSAGGGRNYYKRSRNVCS